MIKSQWLRTKRLFVPLIPCYNTDTLVETGRIYLKMKAAGQLYLVLVSSKMSKSLDNGIYLADDADTFKEKEWWGMYAPVLIILERIQEKSEGAPAVFHYLDVFTWVRRCSWNCRNEKNIINVVDLVMADQTISLRILDRELRPVVRKTTWVLQKDMGGLYSWKKEVGINKCSCSNIG